MGHTMSESTTQSTTPPTPPSSISTPSTPVSAPVSTPITVPRRYPGAPLVGVGVAVYNEQGQLLLVKRGRPPGKGTWGLPGGLLDLGERLEAAAQREVMEEVGVDIVVGDLVTTFETILRDDTGKIEYHYVVLEYWAHYLSGTPVAQDDAEAVAWVGIEELASYSLSRRQHEVLEQSYAAWRAATPPHTQKIANL
jgi:ADP-ribose pyrophosphatase YjhB (NUDIX family)